MKFAIVLISSLCLGAFSVYGIEYYTIASGPKNTAYFETADRICTWLNQTTDSCHFQPIQSSGSIDNLRRLKTGSADLIIAQRDVLVESYYDLQDPYSNFDVVLPLFPEALQIACNSCGTGIISFNKFLELVEAGQVNSIGIGPSNSTTNGTFRQVLDLLGVELHDSLLDERSNRDLIPAFQDQTISAFVLLSAAPLTAARGDAIGLLSLVGFDGDQIKNLNSHLFNLDEVSIPGEVYRSEWGSDTISTIGTWAFLVSRSGFSSEFERVTGVSFPKHLFETLRQDSNAIYVNSSYSNPSNFRISSKQGISLDKVELGEATYEEFYRGLPVSSDVPGYSKTRFQGVVILVSIFLLAIALITFIRSTKNHRLKAKWYKYQHLVYGTMTFLLIAWVVPDIIYWLELNYCKKYNIRSDFLDLSRWEIRSWAFIMSVVGYDREMFPISSAARIAASSTVFLNYLLIGFAFLFTYFRNKRLDKRYKGMAEVKWKNHFVICGWNKSAYDLIIGIRHAAVHFLNEEKVRVCIIHKDVEKQIEEFEDLKTQIADENGWFQIVKGDATDTNVLRKANVQSAQTVLLLADQGEIRTDERTMLRALAISRYARDLQGNKNALDNVYIIAEVLDHSLKPSLLANDVNEVVCVNQVGVNIMMQSAFNHGVSRVLDDLLRYSGDSNEFYLIDLKDPMYHHMIGKTYDELNEDVFKGTDVLLLGIKATVYDENGNEIIDRNLINKMEESGGTSYFDVFRNRSKRRESQHYTITGKQDADNRGLKIKRTIMINPRKDEKKYKTDDDDQLFVLAFNKQSLGQLRKANKVS